MNSQMAPKFFFIHVMKTGGTTFQQHLRKNFTPPEVYPNKRLDQAADSFLPYRDIAFLLGLAPARRKQIHAYFGHFPFFVTQLLGEDLVTMTLLRNPVERTISYLNHCKLYHAQHKDLTLEQIYDDPEYRPMFIANHQTKVFSLTADDKPESIMEIIDIDDDRLRIACENLEKIDVLGLHEHYGEFLQEMRDRYGWQFGEVGNWYVTETPAQVSAALRDRIAADNAVDLAFYEYACGLHARRRQRSIS
jgi:hypothetical protein